MQNNPILSSQTKGILKYRAWLIALVLLIIIGGLVWYNNTILHLYYVNARVNHFKPGDKVYANEWRVNERNEYGAVNIKLFELVCPLKETSKDKPFLIDLGWQVSGDSLFKYKSASFGTYIDYTVLNERFNDKYYPMIYYSVKLNRKSLFKEYPYYNPIPPGYVKVDGPFYIMSIDATDHEVKNFKIRKGK
ncbi:hypothetical protein [Mucilaginibacter terrae]|uniref:Uncharacterized protein n=1 Tax=Mucilaginibacter terrae TaxID=1955052 RepID=A0ABU3GZB3_9SPHI|nr:hypothetical protein [Mucilaginibacter terrae]MDT3405107.1 hypothetical protein [Mucilaginibacter terrae]